MVESGVRMSSRLAVRLIFFFNDTATTEIYTLSLHDALPIRKPARCIFLCLPSKNITPVAIFRKTHFWNSRAGKADAEHGLPDHFLADVVFIKIRSICI